jgi:hypothetical protein
MEAAKRSASRLPAARMPLLPSPCPASIHARPDRRRHSSLKAEGRRVGRRERGAAEAAHAEWEQKLETLAQRLSFVSLEREHEKAQHEQERAFSASLLAERKTLKALAAAVAGTLSHDTLPCRTCVPVAAHV